MTTSQMPQTKDEFYRVFEQIDNQLKNQGIEIPSRPIRAMSLLSKQLKIPLPITPPITGNISKIDQYWPISDLLLKWYEGSYGDRLKRSGPGRMVILLRGDPWVIYFPRFWGEPVITAKRKIETEHLEAEDQTGIYNVLDSIENPSPGLLQSLSDEEILRLRKAFDLGRRAFVILESFSKNDLIKLAMNDYDAVVTHLMALNPSCGLAKWSSMQAAEKVLKFAIDSSGNNYPRTHNLCKLSEQMGRVGFRPPAQQLLDEVSCTSSSRYTEQQISIEQAILANDSSLQISLRTLEQVDRLPGTSKSV